MAVAAASSAPEVPGAGAGIPWGPHSLRLELPCGGLVLGGLSRGQRTQLAHQYRAFITSPRPRQGDLHCQGYQLGQAPLPAPGDLTRNGQYAPRKRRQAGTAAFELTGVNFRARVAPHPRAGHSLIGTAREDGLAQANVIENFLRVLCAHVALARGGLVLHSAGLVIDGAAYIFCGRSNAGKTTLTRKGHAAGATVLSDDINLLLPDAGGFRAHAVPFTGEFGRRLDQAGERASYPVAALALLEQGPALAAATVSGARAVTALAAGCPFVNHDAREWDKLMRALSAVVSALPVVRLACRREDQVGAILAAVDQAGATL